MARLLLDSSGSSPQNEYAETVRRVTGLHEGLLTLPLEDCGNTKGSLPLTDSRWNLDALASVPEGKSLQQKEEPQEKKGEEQEQSELQKGGKEEEGEKLQQQPPLQKAKDQREHPPLNAEPALREEEQQRAQVPGTDSKQVWPPNFSEKQESSGDKKTGTDQKLQTSADSSPSQHEGEHKHSGFSFRPGFILDSLLHHGRKKNHEGSKRDSAKSGELKVQDDQQNHGQQPHEQQQQAQLEGSPQQEKEHQQQQHPDSPTKAFHLLHGPPSNRAAAPGSLLGTPSMLELYKVKKDLGQGHLGQVTLVRCKAHRKLYACKTVNKKAIHKVRHVEEVTSEILAMAELQNTGLSTHGHGAAKEREREGPFLLRMHEVFDDSEAVHMLVEFCEGGDLLHHIRAKGHMGEEESALMLRHLASGLGDMHRANLVHRDVKPENILLTKPEGTMDLEDIKNLLHPHHGGGNEDSTGPNNGSHSHGLFQHKHHSGHPKEGSQSFNPHVQFKLGDLGSCARLGPNGKIHGLVGSPKYMAPEVIRGEEYGEAVDVWSLGVVLYCCLSGRQPFVPVGCGQEIEDVFQAVLTTSPDFRTHPWSVVSKEGKDLVAKMLTKDAAQRITLPEVLHHPWLLKHCPSTEGDWDSHSARMSK